MYLDIPANDNLDEDVMATFAVSAAPKALHRAHLWRGERWQCCAICGWSEQGATQAWIQEIEESGDGPALLIIGGAWGLRLATLADDAAAEPVWDLDDPQQWAEPFLICRPDLRWW